MKNYINMLYLFAFASLIQSCIGSAHSEKLNGGYYLSAIDVNNDMNLGYQDGDYGVGVVGATIFAVGQNKDFIIVKQHPRAFPNEPDKTVINYFIIPLKNKVSQSPEKNIFGPLTNIQFEQKRKELNIEDLDFTIVFKDLQ